MYLTRFRLNTARPGARRLLSTPQAMHAAVMAAFPDLLPSAPPQQGDPRVLWRLDHHAQAEVFLYLVSPGRPDLTHLVEQAGWPAAAAPDSPGWHTKPYSPLLDRLTEGDRWAFRLTANPIHHIRRKPDEPTKRTAHLTPTHQMAWLLDSNRLERAGFRILEKPDSQRLLPGGTTHAGHPHNGDRYHLTVRDKRTLTFSKNRTQQRARGGAPVSLVTVTFDGQLEITNAEAMRRTLAQGIGKAKAYGCGLLTLAPLPKAA